MQILLKVSDLSFFILLTLLAPGFWVLVIPLGGRGAQSVHIQFEASKLLFDLETLYMLSET